MKKTLHRFINPLLSVSFLLSGLLIAYPTIGSADEPRGFHLDEIGTGAGYAAGHMRSADATFKAIPVYLRFGFDMNALVGMQESNGTLQLAFEPFCNPVINPESGIEAGLTVFFRYLHPVAPSVKLVSEIGSGPAWLSVESREQGDAGFNFMNQLGLGTQVKVSGNSAITVGYRFRHISNAGLSQPNRGINTSAVVLSWSLLY